MQEIEFARKGGENCKEKNSRTDLTIRIRVYLQEMHTVIIQEIKNEKNRIRKEMSLQGTELASNGGGICKEWTL